MCPISDNSYLNSISQNIVFSHYRGFCCSEHVLMLPLSDIVLHFSLLSFSDTFSVQVQDTSVSSCGHCVTRSMLTLIAGSSGQSTGLTTKQLGYTSMILKVHDMVVPAFCFFLGPREAYTPWHVHLVENQCPLLFCCKTVFDVFELSWYCFWLASMILLGQW